jgi:hypothetical protein
MNFIADVTPVFLKTNHDQAGESSAACLHVSTPWVAGSEYVLFLLIFYFISR